MDLPREQAGEGSVLVGDEYQLDPLGGPEIWTHSDGEGTFYVIEIATLKVVAKLVAALSNRGHGKLLYHETLGDKAYATNGNDAAVFGIDLANKRVVRSIEAGEGRPGTHGKAYSPLKAHAYFECTGIGKTAVVDTAGDSVIRYLEAAGQPFSSPDGRLTALADRRNNRVHVIDATKDSEIVASIPVDGAPDKVYFSERDDKLYGFTANTLTPDAAVIDFHEMRVIERVAAGDIKRPAGAHTYHRSGETGGGFFFTPASADGVVSIIDGETLTHHAAVPIEGVQEVLYVQSSA